MTQRELQKDFFNFDSFINHDTATSEFGISEFKTQSLPSTSESVTQSEQRISEFATQSVQGISEPITQNILDSKASAFISTKT